MKILLICFFILLSLENLAYSDPLRYIADRNLKTSISVGFEDADTIVFTILGLSQATINSTGVNFINSFTVNGSTQLSSVTQTQLNLLDNRTYIPYAVGTDNYVPLFNGTNNLDASNISQTEVQLLNGMTAVQTGSNNNTTLVTKGYVDDSSSISFCYAMHVTPNNTNGGGSAIGWNPRTINRINSTGSTDAGSCSFASIGSNQIYITAGTYDIEVYSYLFGVSRHQVILTNITDGIVYPGTGSLSDSVACAMSVVRSKMNLASTKTFTVSHWGQYAKPTNGLGIAANSGAEQIFVLVRMVKLF